MTQHEAAEKIVAHEGSCMTILCEDCPAPEIADFSHYCQVQSSRKKWFQRWLKDNPETKEDEK